MNPRRVDAAVDLAYGVLIFVAVVLIAYVGAEVGVAFGFGVLVSYGIHVVWKMARFDPEWMSREVEEAVERTIGETVEEEIHTIQDQVDSVERRIERRPREDEIAEMSDEPDRDAETGSDSER